MNANVQSAMFRDQPSVDSSEPSRLVAGGDLLQARGGAALRTHLMPLQQWLDEPNVTEISVNRTREIWIAKQGEPYMERHDA